MPGGGDGEMAAGGAQEQALIETTRQRRESVSTGACRGPVVLGKCKSLV